VAAKFGSLGEDFAGANLGAWLFPLPVFRDYLVSERLFPLRVAVAGGLLFSVVRNLILMPDLPLELPHLLFHQSPGPYQHLVGLELWSWPYFHGHSFERLVVGTRVSGTQKPKG
jgi:hypothetical protein